MAHAVAAGVRASGASADIRRLPRDPPTELTDEARVTEDEAPVADVAAFSMYDAIVFGIDFIGGPISRPLEEFIASLGGTRWANDKAAFLFTVGSNDAGSARIDFARRLDSQGVAVLDADFASEFAAISEDCDEQAAFMGLWRFGKRLGMLAIESRS